MTFNRAKFTQITLNRSLKHQLERLAPIVQMHLRCGWKASLNETIAFLLEHFYERQTYDLDTELGLSSSTDFSVRASMLVVPSMRISSELV